MNVCDPQQAINMQWGNFTSSHLPLTEYDSSLDAQSIDPGHRVQSVRLRCFIPILKTFHLLLNLVLSSDI